MTEQELQLQEIEVHYTPRWDKPPSVQINSSIIAFQILNGVFDRRTITFQEECVVLYVNNANMPLGIQKLSKGGIADTIVDMRLILGTALTSVAAGIIIAHNHPSGNVNPSETDKFLTQKLKEGCELLDLLFMDHIIITPAGNYFSFADEGLLEHAG